MMIEECRCERCNSSIFKAQINEVVDRFELINELIFNATERNLDESYEVVQDIVEDKERNSYFITVKLYEVEISKLELATTIEAGMYNCDDYVELQDFVINTMQDLIVDKLEIKLRTEID